MAPFAARTEIGGPYRGTHDGAFHTDCCPCVPVGLHDGGRFGTDGQ